MVSASPAAMLRRAFRPTISSTVGSRVSATDGHSSSTISMSESVSASSRAIARAARGCGPLTRTVATATPTRLRPAMRMNRTAWPARAPGSGRAWRPCCALTLVSSPVTATAASVAHAPRDRLLDGVDRRHRHRCRERGARDGHQDGHDEHHQNDSAIDLRETRVHRRLPREVVDLLQHFVGRADDARVRLVGALPENHVHHFLDDADVRVLEEALGNRAEPFRAGR